MIPGQTNPATLTANPVQRGLAAPRPPAMQPAASPPMQAPSQVTPYLAQHPDRQMVQPQANPYLAQHPDRQMVQPQQQQQQQPSPEQMQQFFQMLQQYQQQQQQQQPQPGPQQGYQQRMAQQQANPMTGNWQGPHYAPQQQAPTLPAPAPIAQAPHPAAAYVPQMPAAQVRAPMGTATTVAAPMMQNPVHQALGPQLGATGAAGLAMSDATKKVITQPSLADSFLDHMKPYSYKYKHPSLEPRVAPTGGTYLGVMAQDLERIPQLGPQIVVDTPHGKMVDQKTALSATMAGLARLNERVRALESDVTKKKGK